MSDTEVRNFAFEHVNDPDLHTLLKRRFPEVSSRDFIRNLSANPYYKLIDRMMKEIEEEEEKKAYQHIEANVDTFVSEVLENSKVKYARLYASLFASRVLPQMKEDIKPWTDFLADMVAERMEEKRASSSKKRARKH